MPIRVEHSIEINAQPAKVWNVMTDIDRWHEWSDSINSAKRVDAGPFKVGSSALLDVRGTQPSAWTVTELTNGQSFTWETTVRNVHVRAAHVIDPVQHGDSSRVTLTTVSSGVMAYLFFPLILGVNRRNLKAEAEGLKKRCEATSG